MAVTFNGPLKISRPGYSANGIVPDTSGLLAPSRQAWYSPVSSVLAVDIASGGVAANFTQSVVPAGSLITDIRAIVTTAPAASETLTISIGSTSIATITFSAAGIALASATAAQAANWVNTGINDLVLSSSGNSGSAVGIVLVSLVLRNADGSLSDEGYRPFAQ